VSIKITAGGGAACGDEYPYKLEFSN